MLRAPLTIGDDAKTGAGAVVTRDVPAGKLAVGMPARMRDPRPIDPDPAPEPTPAAAQAPVQEPIIDATSDGAG
jgi:serine acetyltransferase